MEFSRRVLLKDPSNRDLRYLQPEKASILLTSGNAVISARHRDKVDAIRLVSEQAALDCDLLARPGSYGICRERVNEGSKIYQHHNQTWENVLRRRIGA